MPRLVVVVALAATAALADGAPEDGSASVVERMGEFIANNTLVPHVDASEMLDELDEFIRTSLDPRVVNVVAACGAPAGALFAVFGSRNARFSSTIVGALVGLAVGEFLSSKIDAINNTTALGLIFGTAAVFGLLALCLLRVAKILIGASFGLVAASFIQQTGLSAALGHDAIVWALLVALVLACALVSYVVFQYAVGASCGLVGGFVWAISINHFLDTGLNLRLIAADPAQMHCTAGNWHCWLVLGSGALVGVVGTLVSWRRLCAPDNDTSYRELDGASSVSKKVASTDRSAHSAAAVVPAGRQSGPPPATSQQADVVSSDAIQLLLSASRAEGLRAGTSAHIFVIQPPR